MPHPDSDKPGGTEGQSINCQQHRVFSLDQNIVIYSPDPNHTTHNEDPMNEGRLNELLDRCESPIERQLLNAFYPHLPASHTLELEAQHWENLPESTEARTKIDFVFPYLRIAIYCDGFKWHGGDREKFRIDGFNQESCNCTDGLSYGLPGAR